MSGTEGTRIREAAALVRKARDLSRAQASHRLRILMDMTTLELAKEIERLNRQGPRSSYGPPTIDAELPCDSQRMSSAVDAVNNEDCGESRPAWPAKP